MATGKRQHQYAPLGWCAAISLTLALAACKPPPDAEGRPAGVPKNPGKVEDVKETKVFLTRVRGRAVQRGDINTTIATTGSVVPYRSRLLRTEEAGRLVFPKSWQEGDFVEKGTVIATIDSDTLEGDIERSRADLALQEESLDIGKKSMDSAVREFQTLQDLYTRGIAALKDLDTTQLSMERAINSHRQNLINLEKAKASLQTLVDRLERLQLVAPFDGLLVARTTLEGTKPFSTTFGSESITDYDRRLVSAEFAVCGLIEIERVLLRCDLTSKDIDSVNLGQTATATIFGQQDINVTGTVVDIGRSANQDTRAFQVDVLVENPERALRPGMFGRVEIVTETKRDAIYVDKDVLTRRNNKSVVFATEKGIDVEYDIARERVVELGLESRDRVEITWGLQEGDVVITRGFEILQDKTPVSILREDLPTVDAESDTEADTAPTEEDPG